MKKLAVFASVLAMASPAISTAQVIHYTYSGTITDVRDYDGSGVAQYIPFGTKFTGSFDYDPTAKLSELIDSGRALFNAPLAPTSTTIGQYTFNKGVNQLQILNDPNGLYFLSSDQSDFSQLPASMGGFAIVTRIQLYGDINNFALPSSLDLKNFPGFVAMTGYSTSGAAPSYFAWNVSGNLATLTATVAAVPEATTWAMMMVGLGVIGGSLRRRKIKTVYAAG